MDLKLRCIRGTIQKVAARRNVMPESTARTVARNDGTYAEASERIRALTAEVAREVKVAFRCECGLDGCCAIVRLRLDAYEELRSGGRRFLIAPGHEPAASRDARVVARHSTYVLVEKIGAAARVRRRASSSRRLRAVQLQHRG